MTDYKSTRHCVFRLTYHLVFVTKYRRPVISDEIGDFMKQEADRLCGGYGCELISAETDRDHMHLLVSMLPSSCLTTVVRSLKTQLSKSIHRHPVFGPEVQKQVAWRCGVLVAVLFCGNDRKRIYGNRQELH